MGVSRKPKYDDNERIIVRNAYSSEGTTYQFRHFDIQAANPTGLTDKYWSVTNSAETNWAEVTVKVFDSANRDHNHASFDGTDRVRTELEIDFPAVDLIGAQLFVPSSLTGTGRWALYVLAGPMGLGDAYLKHMISGGANLQHHLGSVIDIDGKASKHLEPDTPVTDAHLLRVVIIHPSMSLPAAGADVFSIACRHYR